VVPALAEGAGPADAAKASEQARAALRALIERAAEGSGGAR
jgi:hypothetical protein